MMYLERKHRRRKAIICNFGTGGHKEQMRRLVSHIEPGEFLLIAQSPTNPADARYKEHSRIYKVRPDYSNALSILAIPFFVVANVFQSLKLLIRYDVRMIVSTGSGVAIIPSVLGRLFGAKVLFFESWSRFSVPSLSGIIMHRIAHVFFVQNERIQKFYKNARYMGQL